ncbi:MAG TPA: hypothetical protein VIL92_06530 [Gaiellaceae bacterium]
MKAHVHVMVVGVGQYEFKEPVKDADGKPTFRDDGTAIIVKTIYPYVSLTDGDGDSERFTVAEGVTIPDAFSWIDGEATFDVYQGKAKRKLHGWTKSTQVMKAAA